MKSRLIFLLALFLGWGAQAQTTFPSLPHLHQYSESLASAGQPARGQFAEIAAAGVEVIINLSPVNVPGAIRDEKQVVESVKMKYFHIPVDWDKPAIEDAAKFLAIMDESRGRKVLVHCWVNARSSAFVYLARTLRGGEPIVVERETLTKIWDSNRGYELRNMPQWVRFIDEAQSRLAK